MHYLSYLSENLALCKRGRPEFGYDSATKIVDDEDSIEYLPTQDMPQTQPLNDTAGHECTTKKKNTSKKKETHRRKHTESMQPNTTDNLATLDTPQSGSSSASAASAFCEEKEKQLVNITAARPNETKHSKDMPPKQLRDTIDCHNINTENAAQDKSKEQEEPSDFSAAGNEDQEDYCMVASLLMHTRNAKTQSFLVLFSDGSCRWQEEKYLETHIVQEYIAATKCKSADCGTCKNTTSQDESVVSHRNWHPEFDQYLELRRNEAARYIDGGNGVKAVADYKKLSQTEKNAVRTALREGSEESIRQHIANLLATKDYVRVWKMVRQPPVKAPKVAQTKRSESVVFSSSAASQATIRGSSNDWIDDCKFPNCHGKLSSDTKCSKCQPKSIQRHGYLWDSGGHRACFDILLGERGYDKPQEREIRATRCVCTHASPRVSLNHVI